ncbi:Hypothetical predicted protein, partial [Olea europaea subsp. europaea]
FMLMNVSAQTPQCKKNADCAAYCRHHSGLPLCLDGICQCFSAKESEKSASGTKGFKTRGY